MKRCRGKKTPQEILRGWFVCKLNLRKRIRAQRCYRHFRCVSKRKVDDFNVSRGNSVVAQALQIPLKHLSSNRLELQSLTSQSGCSFDMFKNLRRMGYIGYHENSWNVRRSVYMRMAPNLHSTRWHQQKKLSWACCQPLELHWVGRGHRLKFGGWARRPVNPHVLWGLRDWRIHRDRWPHNFACGSREEFWQGDDAGKGMLSWVAGTDCISQFGPKLMVLSYHSLAYKAYI